MKEKVFFIGIGGSGMMPLANLASQLGYIVSGSDSDAKKALLFAEKHFQVFQTQSASNITDQDIVVYSSAISSSHPEMTGARENGKEVLHRMEFLNRIADRCAFRIAVAGTHGKTSTTSMIGWVLKEVGLDPDIIAGGRPLYLPDGVRMGRGETAVYETDESDGTFLRANAQLRLCLNVDHDHLDYYGNYESLCHAFSQFIEGAKTAVVYENDPYFRELESQASYATLEEPFQSEAQMRSKYRGIFEDGQAMHVIYPGGEGQIRLLVPGRHFARNALGAFALLNEGFKSGLLPGKVDGAKLLEALNTFPGVERRIEKIGAVRGCAVYDDYGHHPTEIRAVILALRERLAADGKLIVVFQPHRFTRTRDLHSEFAAALSLADRVYLLPLYSSGEAAIPGVDSSLILRDMSVGKAELLEGDALAKVFETTSASDVVISQGAGDISGLFRNYLDKASIRRD